MLVITSAECDASDYWFDNPAEVVAVDLNPRQNALFELKLALIRHGDYEDLFAVFGRGITRISPGCLAPFATLFPPMPNSSGRSDWVTWMERHFAVLFIITGPRETLRG